MINKGDNSYVKRLYPKSVFEGLDHATLANDYSTEFYAETYKPITGEYPKFSWTIRDTANVPSFNPITGHGQRFVYTPKNSADKYQELELTIDEGDYKSTTKKIFYVLAGPLVSYDISLGSNPLLRKDTPDSVNNDVCAHLPNAKGLIKYNTIGVIKEFRYDLSPDTSITQTLSLKDLTEPYMDKLREYTRRTGIKTHELYYSGFTPPDITGERKNRVRWQTELIKKIEIK